MNKQPLTYTDLKEEFEKSLGKANEFDFFKRRIRRAISGIRRAELEKSPDVKFILLWIAFNSAYAIDDIWTRDKKAFQDYLLNLSRLSAKQIDEFFEITKLRKSLSRMVDNRYVYFEFWEYVKKIGKQTFDEKKWKKSPEYKKFDEEKQQIALNLADNSERDQTQKINYMLEIVFNRLYVLRNQIMHGGATWHGDLNQEPINNSQVEDGVIILEILIPVFISIMMAHPANENAKIGWGEIPFPVRHDIRE